MKIKDRLIHLLGGHTKEEVLKYSRPVVHVNNAHIKKIKAGYCISDPHRQPPESWLKNELAAKLINKMLEENLITYYTVPRSTGESDYPQDVYAVVNVVESTDIWN
jgi:hypothetical protein